MEVKKTKKADLEKQRGVFFQIGLLAAVGIVFVMFGWTSSEKDDEDLSKKNEVVIEEDVIPITRQNEPPPPPPPPEPPQVTEELEIVEDDKEVEEFEVIDNSLIEEKDEVELIIEEEETIDEDQVFVIVEDMPSFQGKGKEGFRKWIARNMEYPELAREMGISGTVYVQFVVDQNGGVSDVQVVRGVDKSLDREALRVVTNSPKWNPGKQRGKPVKVKFVFPIRFVLQ